MGDAAISALVNDVLGRLTTEVIKEFSLLWGFKMDILSLKEYFIKIQAVLEDAEEKHITERAVELWLKSLRSASLEVENVLDEISTETLLQRLHKKRGIKYMVRAFFSSTHNQLMFHVRVAHKVKAMRKKLADIASKRSELRLTPSDVISDVDDGVEGQMPDRETSSLIHRSLPIFGRDEEIKIIIKNICNKEREKYDDSELRVYGIWGMGGVGKTTLVQLVYNDERVDKYFEVKCWIYVSQKFQVKEIIKGIIESIDNSGCNLTLLDKLQESLQSKLRGKKFLIVLDDVWVEESGKADWEELRETLSCGAKGSTIVTTTRSSTTCHMMTKDAELQHEVGCLSEEHSWLLFEKHAFAQGRVWGDAGRLELEPIGKEIVKKCKGLPLAVKTLGSLMWSKRSKRDWVQVKDNIIWNLKESKVLPALKLSYDNLVPHLKRCFSYCCMFPKGYELKKDELIPLWVSNGFIPPRGEMDLYVLGEEVFDCLLWRSFFSKVRKHSSRYIMHDLLHDMARDVMGDDCLGVEPGKVAKIPNEALHLSLRSQDFQFSPQDIGKLISLRSIFLFHKGGYSFNVVKKLESSKIFNHMYLRVLYLPGIGSRTLLESICRLKHLKYLNLSHSNIVVLPESFMYLQNLQVLILNDCSLYKLPKGLRYLSRLNILDIGNCSSLLYLPIGIKELTSLRRLNNFPIDKENGAKIGELGSLNLLEGELEISGLKNVKDLSEAKSANLKCKDKLSVLRLVWGNYTYVGCEGETFAEVENVLEGLEPNPCIKKLKIRDYIGMNMSPIWIANLSNLVEIRLSCCKNCVHTPALGKLPSLKAIHLWSMNSLECFHDDDTEKLGDTTNRFISLQELSIYYCHRLVSLPNNFPKLKVLKLIYCEELVSLPDKIQNFTDLNELLIDGCNQHLSKRYAHGIGVDWPKISHIPNISIESYPEGVKITFLLGDPPRL